MGTASTTKIIVLNDSALTEVAALKTSAGAADAGRVIVLNDAGVLDLTAVNAKAGNAGAGDANTVVSRDATGRISMLDMPVGLGADTANIQASEALAAGDYVNIHEATGAFRVRKADATVAGKEAQGFVLAAVASGAQATVYFEGTNTQVTGQTPGKVFLQTTAGRGAAAAPNGAGNVVQNIGFAVSATAVNFQAGVAITKAA